MLGRWLKRSPVGDDKWRQVTANAIRSMKQFLLLPGDPEMRNCGRTLDTLGSEIADNANLETLEKEITHTVSQIASKQQGAVDGLIFELDESLRELVNTLDSALYAGDSIADSARSSYRRLRSLEEVESFNEWKSVVHDEVQGLLKSVHQYSEVSREIHDAYCEEIETMRTRLDAAQLAAKTDALTRLPNRSGHEFYLHAAIAKAMEGAPFALALLDLNGFKKINDELGHSAGDAALIAFATMIREAIGKNGFVARLGGDEFTIVYRGSAAQLQSKLDKLSNELEETSIELNGEAEYLQMSFGVSTVSGRASYSDVMKEADDEMYAAKRRHRLQRAS